MHLRLPSKNTPLTNTPNSLPCRFLWGIAALPLGVYGLNVPLTVQPQLFGLFSLFSWGECLYYGPTTRSRAWCAVVLGGTLVLWGALEEVMVLALRVRVFCLTISSDLV